MSLTAPAAVRSALRKGLVLVREGYAGKGLRGETVRWAERLADGEPIDYAKAKKMRGWFARHGVAKAESAKRLRDPKSPASVSYLLWGGTPSIPFRKVGWQDPVAPWLRDVIAKFESQRTGRRAERNSSSTRSALTEKILTPQDGVRRPKAMETFVPGRFESLIATYRNRKETRGVFLVGDGTINVGREEIRTVLREAAAMNVAPPYLVYGRTCTYHGPGIAFVQLDD